MVVVAVVVAAAVVDGVVVDSAWEQTSRDGTYLQKPEAEPSSVEEAVEIEPD